MAHTILPAEMILYIIECLIPPNPPLAFRPDHVVTRTLLNLTFVCRLVSRTASQLLIKHCLHIDTSSRLDQLLRHGPLSSARNGTTEPRRHLYPASAFLSPFPDDNLNLPETVMQIDSFASIICGSLTRLVIDMPLRRLYPEEDHQRIRPVLRGAFARMRRIEEFCSVRDELYLSTVEGIQEPAIWAFWPHLRRLALYNVDVASPQFLNGLRRCLELTHLVIVRPDGLREMIPQGQLDLHFLPRLQRLIVVNTAGGFLHNTPFNQRKWEQSFVGRLHSLRSQGDAEAGDSDSESGSVASYLTLRIPFGRDDDDIQICQEWLSANAMKRTLWGLSDLRALI